MNTAPQHTSLKLLLLVGLLAYCLGGALFTYSYSVGPNYRNVSIDTRVNITQSLPVVLSVIIESGAPNITLIAGYYKNITCNTTILDYNGGSTINNVSAVFYHNATANSSSPDDNNSHYTTDCTPGLGPFDATTRNVTCTFPVWYYANSGTWYCNVTVTDPYPFGNASRQQWLQNKTNIDALLALNVTPLIDYGDMAVGDTSSPQQANVTNLGNVNINISVKGYGRNLTDGLAMVCAVGNITVQNEKFSLFYSVLPSSYTNLSNTQTMMANLTVRQQTNDSAYSVNATYWVLYVPPNPFGVCNGTIIFQAEAS